MSTMRLRNKQAEQHTDDSVAEEHDEQHDDNGKRKKARNIYKYGALEATYLTHALLLCSFIGLLMSAWIYYEEYFVTGKRSCDYNEIVACSKVLGSKYARVFNVPLAVWGVIFNLVWFSLAIKLHATLSQRYLTPLMVWGTVGFLSCIAFVAIEIHLGALCPNCTVVHVVSTIGFLITTTLYARMPQRESLIYIILDFKIWLYFIVLLHAIPLIYVHVIVPNANAQDVISPECLMENNVFMFGSSHCSACRHQKTFFDFDPEQVAMFVECSQNRECKDLRITALPTWIKYDTDGATEIARHVGVMSIQELKEFSGC